MRFVVSAAVAALAFSAVPAQAARIVVSGFTYSNLAASGRLVVNFNSFEVTEPCTTVPCQYNVRAQIEVVGQSDLTQLGNLSFTSLQDPGGLLYIVDQIDFAGDLGVSLTGRANLSPREAVLTFGGRSIRVDGFQNGVPEPATWAMMIAGFGLVGGVTRRSRQTASA